MWYLCIILIFCVGCLENSVARADENSSCEAVKINLEKINGTLQGMRDTVEVLEDPTKPPTSTLLGLIAELNKYNVRNCTLPEDKGIIEGIPSNISALKRNLKRYIAQYTQIITDLNNTYAEECKAPSSQRFKTLADKAADASKTITKIQGNSTDELNNMTQSVKELQSNTFACVLVDKYTSIETDIENFNASVYNEIGTQRKVISSVLTQKLAYLKFATERIQRFDVERRTRYRKRCSRTPSVVQTVDANFTPLYESFVDIHYNFRTPFLLNTLDLLDRLINNTMECSDAKCIDSQVNVMQTTETHLLNNINKIHKNNVTTLIKTAKATAIRDFNKKIDEQFKCHLKILIAGRE